MADHSDKDFIFIMTCIKHAKEKLKPDFEQVAEELGAKNAYACYKRHWDILKKWGLAGNTGKGRKAANGTSGVTTPSSGKKRPRAAPKRVNSEDDADQDELGDSKCSPSERKKVKQYDSKKVDGEMKKEETEEDAEELA